MYQKTRKILGITGISSNTKDFYLGPSGESSPLYFLRNSVFILGEWSVVKLHITVCPFCKNESIL